jgi:hypothetical protein
MNLFKSEWLDIDIADISLKEDTEIRRELWNVMRNDHLQQQKQPAK